MDNPSRIWLILLFLLFVSTHVSAQDQSISADSIAYSGTINSNPSDTVRNKKVESGCFTSIDSASSELTKSYLSRHEKLRQSIVPAALATASLGIMAVPRLKYDLQERLNWNKEEKVVLYDDQLRYLPMAVVPVLTVAGVDGMHPLLDQIALGAAAYIFADFIVYRTKLATKVQRPEPSTSTESFPSQHTSIAFISSTLLHKEFGHISPWISVVGYATAAWVGYARVARNRHFVPDVLMGAAVGTLSTHATYWLYDWLEPIIKGLFTVSPALVPGGMEVQWCYRF